MSVEAIDHALRLRRDERDRISGDLLDLENHHGHRLLQGAELRGESLRRWEAARALMVTVWWLYDAYQRTLARAEEIRARDPRPRSADLAELEALLTEQSVELRAEDVPVEQRSLLRPVAGERISLDQLVARMDAAYREVAELAAAVDRAWSVLAPPLNAAEAALRAAEEARHALGADDAELARLAAELSRTREDLRADPLSCAASGTEPLDRLRERIDARRTALERAVTVRDGFDARRAALRRRIAEVAAAEDAARQARDVVLVKIFTPVLPALPHQAPALADRLAALDVVHGQAAWSTLAQRATDLERAAGDALAQAEAAARTITELLDRRDELRGRLQAFHAKAVRLGHAEHPELAELYRRARELLWTAPCDLRQATVAVASYQRAIKGAGG